MGSINWCEQLNIFYILLNTWNFMGHLELYIRRKMEWYSIHSMEGLAFTETSIEHDCDYIHPLTIWGMQLSVKKILWWFEALVMIEWNKKSHKNRIELVFCDDRCVNYRKWTYTLTILRSYFMTIKCVSVAYTLCTQRATHINPTLPVLICNLPRNWHTSHFTL